VSPTVVEPDATGAAGLAGGVALGDAELDEPSGRVCDAWMPDDYILQWGSPALYEKAPAVKVFDDLLRAQATRLRRRLEGANGAGLAATQVGSLRRMFAFRLSPEDETEVLVNPRVAWRSKHLELFTEGCLSFNSVLVAVRRPFAVRVVGYDVDGNEREFECEDFEASLMQHEIDHLDGILTLHRAAPAERYRAMNALLNPETKASRAA
jgi:peptide deformylase